jgi:hypothetical protein
MKSKTVIFAGIHLRQEVLGVYWGFFLENFKIEITVVGLNFDDRVFGFHFFLDFLVGGFLLGYRQAAKKCRGKEYSC